MVDIASILALLPAASAPPLAPVAAGIAPQAGAGSSFALTLADFLDPALPEATGGIPITNDRQVVADKGKDLPGDEPQPALAGLWFAPPLPVALLSGDAEDAATPSSTAIPSSTATPSNVVTPTTIAPLSTGAEISEGGKPILTRAATAPIPLPAYPEAARPTATARGVPAARFVPDAVTLAVARPAFPPSLIASPDVVPVAPPAALPDLAGMQAVVHPAFLTPQIVVPDAAPVAPPAALPGLATTQTVAHQAFLPPQIIVPDTAAITPPAALPDFMVTRPEFLPPQIIIPDTAAVTPPAALPDFTVTRPALLPPQIAVSDAAPVAPPAPPAARPDLAADMVAPAPSTNAPQSMRAAAPSPDVPADRPVANAAPTLPAGRVSQPETPVIQPAGRAFAVAIAAAANLERRPAPSDDRHEPAFVSSGITSAGELTDRAAVQPAADVRNPALDLRQERGLQGVIDRIELLRDDASDRANARDTRIRLVPDALGGVDIALRKTGDTIHVHFTADSRAAATLIAEAQPRLSELAEARGMKLGQTSVGVGGNPGNNDARPQHQPAAPPPAAPARVGTIATDAPQSDYLIA